MLGPNLWLRHRLQFFLNLGVAVMAVSLDLELVNGLQQLRFLVQQLSLSSPSSGFIEARVGNALSLVETPSLQLLVEHAEVLEGSWVHPSFDLSLVTEIGLQLPSFRLSRFQIQALLLCSSQLASAPSRHHASGMALDDDTLLQHKSCLVCTAEIWSAWLHDDVLACIHEETNLLHLRAIVAFTLSGACAILVGLRLAMETNGMDIFLLCRSSLRDGMVKHGPARLVPIAPQIWLFHNRSLHVYSDELLLTPVVHYSQLQRVRHHVLLCWLLLIVVYPQLNASPVAWLQAQLREGLVIRQDVADLCSA
mmetsp:Transcript_79035/g.139525  ORF Transcript_79035/g.139525 Transcript_79035/m.139525 type:complete len:308 (+) Transcript_79035:431-1354(+)